MHNIQADVEEKTGQDQPEDSRTSTYGHYEQNAQDDWVMEEPRLAQARRVGLRKVL